MKGGYVRHFNWEKIGFGMKKGAVDLRARERGVVFCSLGDAYVERANIIK